MEITSSSRLPVVSAAGPVRPSRPDDRAEPKIGSDAARLPNAVADTGRSADVLEHRVEINAATQDVVFQAINQRSGEVVNQYPDQAILRLRAYLKAAAAAANSVRQQRPSEHIES